MKVPNTKIHVNPSSANCSDTRRETDGQTERRKDMMKVTGVFREYATCLKAIGHTEYVSVVLYRIGVFIFEDYGNVS
jgi:hypothetical protein